MKSHRKLGFALALASIGGATFAATGMAQQNSDRVVAERIASELASLSEGDRPAVAGPLQQANKALERATGARGGGDSRAGELLEGLAREWAEMAQGVLRAARAEADADARKARAADASVRAERARALLEEAITRRGRAEAELRALTEDAGAPEAPPSQTTKKSQGTR